MTLQEKFDVLQAEHAIATQDITNTANTATATAVSATVVVATATVNANASVKTNTAAIAPVATTGTTFSTNSSNGDINPATSNGLKLYQAATTVLTDTSKINATVGKSKAFIDAMRDDSTKFSWGTLISNIGLNKKQILHDFKNLNLNVISKTMNSIFSTVQKWLSHLLQSQTYLRLVLISTQRIKSSSLREFVPALLGKESTTA